MPGLRRSLFVSLSLSFPGAISLLALSCDQAEVEVDAVIESQLEVSPTPDETLGLAELAGLSASWAKIATLVPTSTEDEYSVKYEADIDSTLAEVENEVKWIAIHIPSLSIYAVALNQEGLDKLAAIAEQSGINRPSHTDGVPNALADELVAKAFSAEGPIEVEDEDEDEATLFDSKSKGLQHVRSWSDGIDTRIRRAIADGYAAASWPYRTIGKLGETPTTTPPTLSGCTGTLVGPRHVLTAAHCITNKNYTTGDATTAVVRFRPRRDQDTAPWGVHDPIWYWAPSGWWTCTSSCNQFDFAYVILDKWSSGFTGGHPGWMGYLTSFPSNWKDLGYLMRGYPVRAGRQGTAPATQTIENQLWGDTETCFFDAGSLRNSGREIDFDCDGSDGMSGATLYKTVDGNTVAFGAYSQYVCFAAGCTGNSFPNTMTVMTSSYASLLTWFRDQCPTTESNCSF